MILGAFTSCNNPHGETLPPVFQSFDHREVKVKGEIGRRIDLLINTNIPKINFDNDFLDHFRDKSENPKVRDGFVGVGMLLDGIVRLAYYSQTEEKIERKNYLVKELIKTQEPEGYIGIFSEGKRQQGWDTHEAGYIILALTNDYLFFNEEKSLLAAQKYADYLIKKNVTVIAGLDEGFLKLYHATSNRKYVDYCINEFGLKKFQFASLQQSRHVYGYLDRALMQLKLNEIEPDEKLLYKPHVAVEFLVNLDALDIIGGAGMWEHFNTSHEGHDCNAETCATAYIIWLMDALLKAEGNSFYGDIMERSIYNALFAAFSPAGDSIRYFTDYESAKEYYPSDTFCCPNNFRRVVASLPQLIYYKFDDGIAINLYNQSSASLKINNQLVTITQETDYPSSGEIKIILKMEKETKLDIKLRIPLWSKNVKIMKNGNAIQEKPKAGKFFTLSGLWKNGDEIHLSIPMKYRFIQGRGKQWEKVALLRGPVVYTISKKINPFIQEKMNLRIDPNTISNPIKDNSYRPGGLKCNALDLGNNVVTFTEFIDPTGIKTFFYLSEPSDLVNDDELAAKLY